MRRNLIDYKSEIPDELRVQKMPIKFTKLPEGIDE